MSPYKKRRGYLMKNRGKIWIVISGLVLVMVMALPLMAQEGDEVLLNNMVHVMVREGFPENEALRLAENNRFMARMCLEYLEETEEAENPLEREQHRIQLEQRIGNAFGVALASAERNYGENGAFHAGISMFSSVRRGMDPELAAEAVEMLAENGYDPESSYGLMLRLTERLQATTPEETGCLMEQLREMTRTRASIQLMEEAMECGPLQEKDSTQSGPAEGKGMKDQAGGQESQSNDGKKGQ